MWFVLIILGITIVSMALIEILLRIKDRIDKSIETYVEKSRADTLQNNIYNSYISDNNKTRKVKYAEEKDKF